MRQLKRAIHKATAPNHSPPDKVERERLRLAALPRYVETTTDLPGFTFRIPDAASFLASWEEIFDREIYTFRQINDRPRILDCGANVGVSCLYFRKRFRNAKITAFEPDPKIFTYLRNNLANSGWNDVNLVAKGVWSSNTTLKFQSEGADAGRIDSTKNSNIIEISTVRLRDFLNEPIDLLKMDIEGAETEVVLDIASCLQNVRNIFVEYHSFIGQPQTLGKLIQTLIEAGFRVQVHPMRVAAHPFIEVESHMGMDMQLNIYGYRVESKS
ncbi:MAG: FkbM family methyltransferase [Verrucomicrobiota bacterium]